ncbi:MAG: FAD:protein FMN transferase [Acholeplasmataceae bacterium]|nr:FAD:protein FMN transferase [Acholeplasmataceae bacterium]
MMFSVSACKREDPNPPIDEIKLYTKSLYDYMDTFITVQLYTTSTTVFNMHMDHIESVYAKYHELSNNYVELDVNSPYKQNIYTINQQPNQWLEIDHELYELFQRAETYKEITDGYFNIAIGNAVNVWKQLIESYPKESIPKLDYDDAIEVIESMVIPEIAVQLKVEDEKQYVFIHEDARIDLGAIAKGYATNLVIEYLIEEEINYFINAGSSTMAMGINPNRTGGVFNIGLQDPFYGFEDGLKEYYVIAKLREVSLATSGNYIQYALYENQKYHHIVSPFSKMPEHFYHGLSVFAKDPGLADAISTALFCMDEETIELWVEEHQDNLELEIIIYRYDRTPLTYLINTEIQLQIGD